jgi:Tfp pilus assembly protein PilN
MIRINLLATERGTAGATPTAPGAVQAYIMLGLAAATALVVCGFGWWKKTADIDTLNAQIAAQQQEKQKLQVIEKQVLALQEKERRIEEQVKLIEGLQRQRDAAMELMSVVSRSLPDFVWLTEMNQTGNRLNFRGQSATLASVADFIAQLQAAGEHCDQPEPPPNATEAFKAYVAQRGGCYFPEVNLVNSQAQQNVVQFQLSTTFQAPRPPPPVAPPAKPAAKPGQPAAKPAAAAQS